jgi:hypothetical protein
MPLTRRVDAMAPSTPAVSPMAVIFNPRLSISLRVTLPRGIDPAIALRTD